MPNSISEIPIATLEKVISILKEIETLKASVNQILGDNEHEQGNGLVAKRRGRPLKSVASPATPVLKVRKKRTFSAASREKMAAAAKARWAKKKAA